METLVLDGKNYVKASKVADELGYTSDYVGQLCRSGKVDAHLIGRTWYVNREMLSEHKVEKKRISRVKAREQVRKSLEEHKQLKVVETKNIYQNVGIRYEEDKSELIPTVRKLQISNESKPTIKRDEKVRKTDKESPYTIENEGAKVIMSGTVKVVDAGEDALDTETTLLSPRILHHQSVSNKHVEIENEADVTVGSDVVEISPVVKKDFLSRIEEISSNTSENNIAVEEEIVSSSLETSEKNGSTLVSILSWLLLMAVVYGLSGISIFIETNLRYTQGIPGLETSYSIQIDTTIEQIRLKI